MPNKLVLHQSDPRSYPENRSKLMSRLAEFGFLGAEFLDMGRNHYLTGPSFLQYISFIGCSPTLYTLESEKSKTGFCHIEISNNLDNVQYLAGNNAKVFRCPHCGNITKLEGPKIWQYPDNDWSCQKCNTTCKCRELDFQQQGGFGRFYIAVWGIAEGLALPSDLLLTRLAEFTGGPWRFFYYDS